MQAFLLLDYDAFLLLTCVDFVLRNLDYLDDQILLDVFRAILEFNVKRIVLLPFVADFGSGEG